MKNLLLASTALVVTAGMAAAEIKITGSANAGYYSGLGNADAVTVTVAEVANGPGVAGVAAVTATSAETYTSSGVYSNAGIVATMSGVTDNGITFSTSVDAEAGTEIDQGDFEFDGPAGGTF
jgi:outer membrane protein OmpU